MTKTIIQILVSLIAMMLFSHVGCSQYQSVDRYNNINCTALVAHNYQALSIDDWNVAKKNSLGISIKQKDVHIFTESSNRYWKFGISTSGILSISILPNDQEPFCGMTIVLLDEDQSILQKCNCFPQMGEKHEIKWPIDNPGVYYLKMSFIDNSPMFQSAYIRFSFSGDELVIPLG